MGLFLEATTVTDSLTTALSGIASDLMTMIGKIAPVAIPVIGAVMVITVGIGVFKKVTSKGTGN